MTGRFIRRRPRVQPQLALSLPSVPKESPLRDAFRRAELASVGIEFKQVLGHPRGAKLLRSLAGAYERSHHGSAAAFARAIAGMRRELTRAP